MSVVSRVDGGLRKMAWLWRDAMRWLLCPRCVRRPVLATCAFTLSRVENVALLQTLLQLGC
eukprot:scaffold90029_cov81-Phaeocystis_antarctica.AAC.1